jgi:uncharacterized protein YodC (DUF2158 family)
MEFKVGDIVVVKSGGPPMTVEKIGKMDFYGREIGVHCCWFVDNKLQRDVFRFDVIELEKK